MSFQQLHGRRLLTWLLQLLLVFALVFGINAWRARDTVSGSAPQLSEFTLSGERFDLVHLKGQPVVVHFWASWCSICALEADTIEQLSQDVQVITVAMNSGSNEAIRAYLADKKLDFRVINDVHGEIARRWGVQGVPASFIIDRQGEIRFVELGYTTGLGLRARLWWASRK